MDTDDNHQLTMPLGPRWTDIRDGVSRICARFPNEYWLKLDHVSAVVEIEGHCDERGTERYNLALGERRAKAAMDYLASLGVPANRLKMVSYGKERPQCTDSEESCWSRNRRGHFKIDAK